MTVERRSATQSNGTFVAFILIGVGVIWLLGQLNVLSGASFAVLFRLWPLILVAIGINLLVGRGHPQVSTLIGIVTVVVFVVLMLIGPSIGLAQTVEAQEAQYQEPLAGVESANVNLDLSVAETTIQAASDSSNLFEADLRYLGDVRYQADGEANKDIRLWTEGPVSTTNFFGFWPFGNFGDNDLRWDINLSPDVPLALDINGGVGKNTFNLSGLDITSLNIHAGVGETHLTLPATDGAYPVTVDGGVGSTDVTIVEGAALTLNINGGVGEVVIDIPENAPVRLEGNQGLGGVDIGSAGLNVMRQSDNEGEWQTEAYAGASEDERIVIIFNGGVGGLRVR
ncbi:MAG: hypothetical protein IT320_20640 [Anaerolineae bacterium]|nr:hypothetical protein [Anaerolineae bacterium]